VLERFAAEHGAKRIAKLERGHVQEMVDARRATPGGARIFLSSISVLLSHAVATGIRADNPALGIKRPRLSKDGWTTWTESDIARFEDAHPIGTEARLALALLVNTGQRVSDVIRMGRQHVHDGLIEVKQQKTGAALSIPVHAQHQAIIDAMPVNNLNFLMTSTGKPFTANGFCHWFANRCRHAGLPTGLSAHGLRKAMCRRLAEAGCTVHQIMAISGHQTLSEVQRYTKAVEQSRMARQAMEAASVTQIYKPDDQVVEKGKNIK
jgi:integrase